MATFRFGRRVDIKWNGYDIQGDAGTVFDLPDQLYDEFEANFRKVEPTLEWIDTDEFGTLQNSVTNYTVAATAPLAISSATSTSGAVTKTWALNANYQTQGTYVSSIVAGNNISASGTTSVTVGINSGTALNGYILAADGSSGASFVASSASGVTTVVGVSPVSAIVSGSAATISINSDLITASSAKRTRSLVRNDTTATIAKGSFVYINSSNGTVPTIAKALATTDPLSSKTFGIVEADILSNADGYVTNQGLLDGLDTSSFADGNTIYLSASVAGAATTVKPTGPNHGVLLGIVVKGGSVGAGSIYVFIKNGAELDEIHDVNISGLANGDTLIYSSTASVWQNKTLANAGIAASVHTHAQVDVTSLTADLAGKIAASTLTAKGTLVGATANATPAVVPVGTDGYILTARSTATTGLAWEAAAAASSTISFNTQTVGYTLALTDKDKIVQGSSTGALTITVPPNSSVAFATGDQVHVAAIGAGQVTIAGGTGVTVNSALGLKLRVQWSSGTLIKRDTNTWLLIGDTEA